MTTTSNLTIRLLGNEERFLFDGRRSAGQLLADQRKGKELYLVSSRSSAGALIGDTVN